MGHGLASMSRIRSRLKYLLAVAVLAAGAAVAATTYTVQSGDTLGGIAQQHGVTTAALLGANKLSDADRLSVGQRLVIPDAPSSAKNYTVVEGDTLGAIAKDHGVDVQAIVALNRMASADSLRVGQALLIPKAGAPQTPRHAPPAGLKAKLDAIPVRAGRWRYIVVHHSATREGSAYSMDLYHRRKRHMENGLAYHFVIGNGRGMGDGEIAIGNRWKRQIKGGHLASDAQNEISIGICLVGNFERDRPSVQQMKSLYALVGYLMQRTRTGPGAVKTHRQINVKPTECPGKNFPTSLLLKNI